MIKRFAFVMLIVLAGASSLYAQTSGGTLKGKIIGKTSQPVAGATAAVQQTALGAVADAEGNYEIKNLPAGTYTVRFSSVGFAPLVKPVTVRDGETTVLDALLADADITAAEVVVSASKYEQSRLDVPITTSVVTAKMIERMPVQNLDRVLESVPGVDLTRSGGIGASSIQIRGSNSYAGGGLGTRIMMLYDGFPMNSADANSVDWTGLAMDNVERVEIVKGSSSALYGSAAMGGVINTIGSLPQNFNVRARFSNGVYDAPPGNVSTEKYPANRALYFYNGAVAIGDRIGGFAYDASYSHLNDAGYREATQMTLDNVKFKAKVALSETQFLQLSSLFNWSTGGIPQAWVGRTEALFNPNPGNYLGDDVKDNQSQLVGLTHSLVMGRAASLETKAYFNRNAFVIRYYPVYDDKYGTVQKYNAADRGVYDANDPSTYNKSDARRTGASSTLNLTLGSSHHLLAGIEGMFDDVQSTVFSNATTTAAGAFVQDEIAVLPKLKVTLSLRFDLNELGQTEVTYTDQRNDASITEQVQNRQSQQLSPRVAAVYALDNQTSLRASFGRSFRAPSLGERFITDAGIFRGNPNASLEPERMTSFEVGVFKQFAKGFSLDVSAYLNDYNNLIESININPPTPANPTAPIVFQFVNIANARIAGVEVALNAQPVEQLSLRLGYNYMNARGALPSNALSVGQNPDPDQLSYRPDHNASFGADFAFAGLMSENNLLSRVSLTAGGRYVSQINSVRIYIDANRKDYPGNFFLADAGFRFNVMNGMNFSANVRNLTNTAYEELEKYRMPGRSYHVGLDFTY